MKKRISMILTFVLVFTSVLGCMQFASIAYEKSFFPTIAFDENEESTESKVYITSDTNCSHLNLFVAAYRSGRLVGIERKDIELSEGKNTINTGINWSNLDKDKISLFVWDDNLVPYAKYEKTIETTAYEGIVVGTPMTDIAASGYSASYLPTLTINNGTKDIALECSQIGDPDAFLGKRVSVNASGDFARSIELSTEYNTVISITANQLCSDFDKYYDEEYIIGYYESTGGRITSIGIAADAKVYVNYAQEKLSGGITTADIAALVALGGRIEFISNNADTTIDIINIISYSDEAVIEEVYEENGYYSFDSYIGFVDDIDTSDDEIFVKVYLDGKIATVADIKENYTVTLAEIARDVLCYYVSSKTATGAVVGYSTEDNCVMIGDDEYTLSPLGAIDSVAKLIDIEGTFFINADGQITHNIDLDDSNYAIVLAAGPGTGVTKSYVIETVLADGTVAEYPLSATAYVEFCNGTRTESDDDVVYESITTNMYQMADIYRVTAEDIGKSVYKIKIKNDKVVRLVKLDCDVTTANKEYDSENMAYGPISFSEETVVVSIGVTGSNLVYSDDITIGHVSDFFADGEGTGCNLSAFDADNNDISGFVIGYGMTRKNPDTGEDEESVDESVTYGVVISTGEVFGVTKSYEIETVLADGTAGTYPLATHVSVVLGDGSKVAAEDDETYEYLADNMETDNTFGAGSYRVSSGNIINTVYKITLRDGEVIRLKQMERGASASGATYDEQNMTYGSVSFDNETIVFSVDSGGLVNADDVEVRAIDDIIIRGANCQIHAFDEDENNIAGLVIGYGLTLKTLQSTDALIIDSRKTVTYNDEEAWVISGLQAGEEVTYTIYNEDGVYSSSVYPWNLKKGDVILPGKANAEGTIADFETIYTVNSGITATDDADEEIHYIAGQLRKDVGYEPTDSRFYLADGYTHGGTDYYKTYDGIVMKSAANYTLVDFSESSKNPEITKKAKSKGIFGTLSLYNSKVFVRYYQDTLKEVIVYRYNV